MVGELISKEQFDQKALGSGSHAPMQSANQEQTRDTTKTMGPSVEVEWAACPVIGW